MTFGALSKTSVSRLRLAIACCTWPIFVRYQPDWRRSGRFGAVAFKETPKLWVRPKIDDRELNLKTAIPTALRRNSRRTRESMTPSGTRVERPHLSAAAFRRAAPGGGFRLGYEAFRAKYRDCTNYLGADPSAALLVKSPGYRN